MTDEKDIEPEEKNKGGRPTKYKPEYCQEILEFFNREPWERKHVEDSNGNKLFKKNGEPFIDKVIAQFPTFEKFAADRGVTHKTLINWHSEEEFLQAYNIAKQMQHHILLQNGLFANYSPQYAALITHNTCTHVDGKRYGSKVDTDLTTGGESLNKDVELSEEQLLKVLEEKGIDPKMFEEL